MVDKANFHEYEPIPRFWHHAFVHGGQIYVRGGRTTHFRSQRSQLAVTIEQFEPTKEVWQQIDTEGSPHPELTQVACVCVGDLLYMYGSDRKVLSQLDLRASLWSELWATTDLDNGETPMIKDACGIVYFADGHLGVLGGYAHPSGPRQPGSDFKLNTYGDENEGWTNEFHLFNIKTKLWLTPIIKGTRPPPTCDFTLNSISDFSAILFGGYQDNGFQDELYIIDFDPTKMEITFTKIEKRGSWPEGRESHAACCLGLNTDHPQLLISGGKNMYDQPLKFDIWMLDIAKLRKMPDKKSSIWKKVRLPGGQRPSRWGHSMTSVFICSGLEAAVVFGGSPEIFGKKWRTPEFTRLAETTILYFGDLGSEWILLEERIKTAESVFFFDRTLSSSKVHDVVAPYELDSQFSTRLIFVMEKFYGIPLLSELAGKNQDFQQQIQVRQPDAPSAITRWLSAAGASNKIKPTWRNLSLVLHNIGLGPLAIQMEDILLERAIATTSTLKDGLTSHYGKVLDKDNDLRRRIQAFSSCSEATISMLKRKYEELRIDFEQLKLHSTPNPTSFPAEPEKQTTSLVKAQSNKEESAMTTAIPGPVLPTGQVQVQHSEGGVYWREKFYALSDESDSTIKLLKKENQRLRVKVEELGDQSTIQIQQVISTTSVKAEPQEKEEEEEDTLTETPQSLLSPSIAGQISDDSQQEEEKKLIQKSQLLAGHSASTIQMLEAQNEELREEIEDLRSQLESVSTGQHINGNVNGAGDSQLCGIDICGETICEITNFAQSFEWEEFGLKLFIDEGTLPEGVDKCIVRIKASLAGQYQFPEDVHLVSGIFLLSCEPMCKFAKSVVLELEHCAKSANPSKLCFVRAVCTQKTLPYTFKKIGGQFSEGDHTGTIKLNGFSMYATGQEGPCQREYGTTVFHFFHQKSVSNYCLKIDVVLTWNTKSHLNAVKREYKRKDAELDSEMVIEFESDEIKVDVPLDDTSVKGGWKITPNTPPIVLKRLVDSYEQGQIIPKCRFSAKIFPREADIPSLQGQIKLNGAKKPYNTVMFDIDPPIFTSVHHASKKRSSSESDIPVAKRPRRELQQSHSLDSKRMPSIAEDMDSKVSSPISSANQDEIASQSPGISKPKMRNLTILKWRNESGEVKKFRLKSHIIHEWRKIGNFVASYAQLEAWSKEFQKNAGECCDAVLNHWLTQPPPDYPATWEGLYELLEDAELGCVATDLKNAVKNAI